MTDELTDEDKTRLLATFDSKKSPDDYDHEFYEMMCQVPPLHITEIDGRIRRAMLRFIRDGGGEASDAKNGGLVMLGFVHGYLVGQKLQRDIRCFSLPEAPE